MLPDLSFSELKERAAGFTAVKKWYRELSQRASVCMILEEHEALGPSFLMIQRAISKHDPWSGQMAFPGGKQDYDDPNITLTALREAQEELGLAVDDISRVGRLSDVLARPYRIHRQPMVVTPLVFEPQKPLEFNPNYEVAEVVWVPLSLFLDESNRQSMLWKKNGIEMQLPCYQYQDKTIWGLSLLMIDEFIQDVVLSF